MSDDIGQQAAVPPSGPAMPDIELLTSRTNQLIEMIRAADARLDELCCRPQTVLQQAQAQAGQLRSLCEKAGEIAALIDPKIISAKELKQAIDSRAAALQDVLDLTETAAKGLMERVRRAQSLAEQFSSMIENAGRRMEGFEKTISRAEATGRSASQGATEAEQAAAKAAEAANAAVQVARELNELSVQCREAAGTLAAEQRKLIDASRSASGELHLLIGQATRLEETFRREAASLAGILERAAAERRSWEAFFQRLPRRPRAVKAAERAYQRAGRPIAADKGRHPGASSSAGDLTGTGAQAVCPSQSPPADAPAVLAARIRRLAGLVRQAAAAAESGTRHSTQPRGVSREVQAV